MRKLASIQKIETVFEIPGADRIELAQILGFKAIVSKGKFHPNDVVVFIDRDSILPEIPEFEFMRKEFFRVKVWKLNKFNVYSEGLVFHLNELPIPDSVEIGDDITDYLGIIKYEPVVKTYFGNQAGAFPYFLQHTNETQLQTFPNILGYMQGKKVIATQKVDGSSATFFNHNGDMGICSHDARLKPENSVLTDIGNEYGIFDILANHNLALQGELCGPGYNGSGKYKNPMGVANPTVMFFSMFDTENYRYFSEKTFWEFTTAYGLPTVKLVKIWDYFDETLESLVQLASEGKYPTGLPQEGIVVRLLGDVTRVSFKVLNPEYQIKVERTK